MPDWISVLGVAMGSAWVSGINLYAAVVTLGLLERFGFAHLPGGYSSLTLLVQPVVAGASGWLLLGEPMQPVSLAGAALILAGVAWSATRLDRGKV